MNKERPRPLLRSTDIRRAQSNMQLAQLSFIDWTRRMRKQILRPLRFRKRDHVADRFGPGHQGNDTVETKREAAVRRRSVLQCVQQKAEFRARLFRCDIERREYLGLHL